ncbi:BlaR1 peptidase M56 [Formosa sp. Hel1_31_208]|uniref:M56 family metallopeptidase n=1 Tax=Formosa sp. Hel1_31_208 TaxID=1798225 RepID=UPI00087BBD06|nr:M56 family metallopeptidase [Formosa sp. Hel1_31_208]SDS11427.1 BlaR1 peptidase M56 [Formosa sp. Hel1_31_208]
MDYLLKASAILIIFYVCYQLFLQRETFFQSNRLFLLSGLILACCLPFIVIPQYIEYTPIDTSSFVMSSNELAIQKGTPYDYVQLLPWFYITGACFFFGKLIIEFLSLRRILIHSEASASGTYKILKTEEQVAPFSFFNRIVFNPKQFQEEELTHVLTHEKVHVKQLHSIDTIFAQLACLLFWFNPVVWLYKKALQQNLEFIADHEAQYVSQCEKSYQTVLLKASAKNHQLAFTTNFHTSLIKKRIVMLHKSKSKQFNKIKLLLILPFLAVFMMSFNTETIYIPVPDEVPKKQEVTSESQDNLNIMFNKDNTDDYLALTKTQLLKKGITFNYKGLIRNSKNEITAINVTFESKVNSTAYEVSGVEPIKPFSFKSDGTSFGVSTMDSNTFVYKTEDGTMKVQSSGGHVYVIEDVDEEDTNDSDSGTLKIIKKHSLDSVHFKTIQGKTTWISKDGTKTNINASENGSANFIITKTDEPIFIINGSAVDKSIFENVDSDNIKSINVLKGKSASELYGEKGKNGVIIMSIKDGQNTFINKDKSKGIILNSNNVRIKSDGTEPLFIIDGKVINKDQMESINPDKIHSIDVLKDKNAIKAYGEKGQNGVVIINTKEAINGNSNQDIIIEVQEDSPWKIDTETVVTGVYFVGDPDDTHPTAEFVISKNSTDAFLDRQKKELKKFGIDAKFSKVRRNKAGEITSIKISLDDNQGRKSSASWKEKDQAIPDIVMGKSKDDKLFVRAIGY